GCHPRGRSYAYADALCGPRPVQRRLPILVGGSGPKKTLRTVALRADGWNTSGPLEDVRGRVGVLAQHRAEVGRDIATIEKTVSFAIILRDDAADAADAYRALMAHNGLDSM